MSDTNEQRLSYEEEPELTPAAVIETKPTVIGGQAHNNPKSNKSKMADTNRSGPNISPGNTGGPDTEQPNGTKKKFQIPPAVVTKVQWAIPQGAQRQQMDYAYAKSVPGLLKIVTTLLAFITFCCAINAYGGSWTAFFCFAAMIVPNSFLTFYVVFPHLLADERTRTGVALVELMFYLKGFIWLFIAIFVNIIATATWASLAGVLMTVLTILMTALFGLEVFFKGMAWKNITNGQQTQTHQMP